VPDYLPVKFEAPEGSEAKLKELLKSHFRLIPLVSDEAGLIFQKSLWEKVDRNALAAALRTAGFSGVFEEGQAYASRFCSP